MFLRALSVALSACLCFGGTARAEPAPLSVEGEIDPRLTAIDQAAMQTYGHDRITHITFHHEGFAGDDAELFRRASAARQKMSIAQRVRNINAWHAGDAGLGMIAYHYAVDRQGNIAKGRPVRFKPATMSSVKGSSRRVDFAGHFAVVALGDFNHERLTPQARRAYIHVMSEAQRAYLVPTARIRPHLDHAATSCPGAHIAAEADSLRREVLFYGLQDELARRGCGALTPDGVWGEESARAFARFARLNGARLSSAQPDDTALFEIVRDPSLTCDGRD